MSGLAIIVFGTWVAISFVTFNTGYKSRYGNTSLDEDRTKTNWNGIALILNVYDYIISVNWKKIFYPTTSIDKEIAEEEKEIAELERQKEKIAKLAELKRRKERLFKEMDPNCKRCGEDSHVRPSIKIGGITQYYCINCERWLHDGRPMR